MDHSYWWRLPGPSRLIGRIVDDLRDGRNVTLCIPDHLPDGLTRAVREELGESWAWSTLRLEEQCTLDPVSALYDRYITDAEPSAIRNASTLATNPCIAGRIIWIEGLSSHTWPAWKRFLTEYQHVCLSRPLIERCTFCVPLPGKTALDPPVEDACLTNHYYRGVVDYLDIIMYTARVIQRGNLSALRHRLTVAVISSLAQWDPRVCDHFANEPLDSILDPGSSLKELAIHRGWSRTREQESLGNCWHLGMDERIDGKSLLHSAALALNDPTSEISRRIWNAEIGVLLPFIEEKRRGFLERYGKILRVPFQTSFGVITDVRDLEIGHIDYQLASCGLAIDPDVRRLVAQLRQIRNALTHLEPIPLGLLQDGGIRFSCLNS